MSENMRVMKFEFRTQVRKGMSAKDERHALSSFLKHLAEHVLQESTEFGDKPVAVPYYRSGERTERIIGEVKLVESDGLTRMEIERLRKLVAQRPSQDEIDEWERNRQDYANDKSGFPPAYEDLSGRIAYADRAYVKLKSHGVEVEE